MHENGMQTYGSSYIRLANFSVFNTNIALSSRVSPNGIEFHIFHCAAGSIAYHVGKQCFVYLHFTNNFVMFISFDPCVHMQKYWVSQIVASHLLVNYNRRSV